jgi:hypothetical protein
LAREAGLEDETVRRREDEWFLKNEKELIERARLDRQKREAARAADERESERKRLRELHWMKCPKCGHELREEVLEGISIDRCTFCEGLWLDASELEQLFLRKTDSSKSLLRKILGV